MEAKADNLAPELEVHLVAAVSKARDGVDGVQHDSGSSLPLAEGAAADRIPQEREECQIQREVSAADQYDQLRDRLRDRVSQRQNALGSEGVIGRHFRRCGPAVVEDGKVQSK